MGGAERTARKRRQEQQAASGKSGGKSGGNAVAKARGGGDSKKVIAIVAAIAVLAAVVIGGVLWTNASKNETEGQSIPLPSGSTVDYPEKREGVVVISGEDEAPVTIDVYADFLCPACGSFYARYGEAIEQRIAAGDLRVRTHMVPMLVEASDPPGYSLDSANAALLAADEGKFTQFHNALFASQPEEGKRGYDDEQLIKLGRDLGITGEAFAQGVRQGTYESQLTSEFEQTAGNPDLQQDFGRGPAFSTPTVVADGSIVDVSNESWLDNVLGNAQS